MYFRVWLCVVLLHVRYGVGVVRGQFSLYHMGQKDRIQVIYALAAGTFSHWIISLVLFFFKDIYCIEWIHITHECKIHMTVWNIELLF